MLTHDLQIMNSRRYHGAILSAKNDPSQIFCKFSSFFILLNYTCNDGTVVEEWIKKVEDLGFIPA